MPSTYNQYHIRLLEELRAAEVEQKKRYDSAIDIEDGVEAAVVAMEARTRIRQIRKWALDLQRLKNEVENTFPSPHFAAQAPADAASQVAQPMVEAAATGGGEVKPIHGFSLLGRSYKASHWRGVCTQLCEVMVLNQPYKFAGLAANEIINPTGRPIFGVDEKPTNRNHKLSNGFYVVTEGSDGEIKARCEKILAACGYSSDDFQIIDGGQDNGCA